MKKAIFAKFKYARRPSTHENALSNNFRCGASSCVHENSFYSDFRCAGASYAHEKALSNNFRCGASSCAHENALSNNFRCGASSSAHENTFSTLSGDRVQYKQKNTHIMGWAFYKIGMTGLEPATSRTPCERSTKLSYIPIDKSNFYSVCLKYTTCITIQNFFSFSSFYNTD